MYFPMSVLSKSDSTDGTLAGLQVTAVNPLDLLSQQPFFTSPRLAMLATQAEVLSQDGVAPGSAQEVLQEYQCSICLDVLRNPVVLTCAHRCGWTRHFVVDLLTACLSHSTCSCFSHHRGWVNVGWA